MNDYRKYAVKNDLFYRLVSNQVVEHLIGALLGNRLEQ